MELLISGSLRGLGWAPVMPLLVAAASVPLAVLLPIWWVVTGAALAVAAGRSLGWRRAATARLLADESSLKFVRADQMSGSWAWTDLLAVEMQRGSSAPRWSLGPKASASSLPYVTLTNRRTSIRGEPIREVVGAFLLLDAATYADAALALSAACGQHHVAFRDWG